MKHKSKIITPISYRDDAQYYSIIMYKKFCYVQQKFKCLVNSIAV